MSAHLILSRPKWLFMGTALILWGLALNPADAQVARIEVHSFQSTTLTDQEFLSGKKDGKPVVLAGELRIPTAGTDRLPAVVLVHGSGGIVSFVDAWAQWLNGLGVATFEMDSFTGRGIVSTTNDQAQLSRLAQIGDSYRALELLAKHPRIDPERIVLMGFSRGGTVVLFASLQRFQRMYGPAGAAFAAYIPFYPDCGTTYIDEDEAMNKPIRIFTGSLDDYQPPAPCRVYVERLRKAGKDAKLTEYAGARHVFDWEAMKTPTTFDKAQNVSQCRLEESPDHRIVNSQTKQMFTYSDPCVKLGETVAYDAQAHSESKKAVQELLTAVFKLK